MIRNKTSFFLLICLCFFVVNPQAQTVNEERAHLNYMLLCQGCHLPDARGVEGNVPRIKDYIGNFLKIEGGREYLVRVPGSANAAINDEQLAELLNWIVMKYAGASLPDNFLPFTVTEVATLRRSPLNEVSRLRAELVKKINMVD